MSKGDGSTALFTSAAPGKPRGFIEAFSQIERYYELETQGRDIPPGLFTTQQKIEFWEVGFISTFWSSVFSIALAPLAIGVIEKYIPVFGGEVPTAADKIEVFMLALSFTIGYASFFGAAGAVLRRQIHETHDPQLHERYCHDRNSEDIDCGRPLPFPRIIRLRAAQGGENAALFQGVDMRADADLHIQLHCGFQGRVPDVGLVCYGNAPFLYSGSRRQHLDTGFY
jgi:hypothetical protein